MTHSAPHRFVLFCLELFVLLVVSAAVLPLTRAQSHVSTQWEELTAGDFVQAMHQAQGTCILPFGILEKHGPQLPLGTDLFDIRYVSLHAAEEEYAIVFPAYYFGQIFEARHEPGTIAYSARMQLDLLQETTDEMARNGCKKIIIANGHGGNENLLPYFAQTQLAVQHDYVVYIFGLPDLAGPGRPPLKSSVDMHAGKTETSHLMIARPDLLHLNRTNQESGEDQKRLSKLPDTLYTGIWWYARFPNHYAGDASYANKALGNYDMKKWIGQLADAIRAVKSDSESLKLQREFFEKAKHPLDTQQ